MKTKKEKTLKEKKTEATKREHVRFRESILGLPRDITVKHAGATYIRWAYQCYSNFGWSRWQRVR